MWHGAIPFNALNTNNKILNSIRNSIGSQWRCSVVLSRCGKLRALIYNLSYLWGFGSSSACTWCNIVYRPIICAGRVKLSCFSVILMSKNTTWGMFGVYHLEEKTVRWQFNNEQVYSNEHNGANDYIMCCSVQITVVKHEENHIPFAKKQQHRQAMP